MSKIFTSSRDGPFCHTCNCHMKPDYLLKHLLVDHTKEELALSLSLIYVEDWRDEMRALKEAKSIEV
jgi:hypothetical protein